MCFFFKQKTAYEMRISDWSSDVCSSDLSQGALRSFFRRNVGTLFLLRHACAADLLSGSPLALFRRTGISDLRRIYGAGVYYPCCRRLSGRPLSGAAQGGAVRCGDTDDGALPEDRKSTRLNSSH